jgi:hypothetical protein
MKDRLKGEGGRIKDEKFLVPGVGLLRLDKLGGRGIGHAALGFVAQRSR